MITVILTVKCNECKKQYPVDVDIRPYHNTEDITQEIASSIDSFYTNHIKQSQDCRGDS